MMDPEDIENIIKYVLDSEGAMAEVVFTNLNIEPTNDLTKFTYDFVIIYFDSNSKMNVEHHLELIRTKIKNYEDVGAPCEIILSISVG